MSYNDNCDDNVIPKMKKNRKKRGEKQKKVLPLEQQAIKSRLSQFNTDPIMWYPETQADFQSSASIEFSADKKITRRSAGSDSGGQERTKQLYVVV